MTGKAIPLLGILSKVSGQTGDGGPFTRFSAEKGKHSGLRGLGNVELSLRNLTSPIPGVRPTKKSTSKAFSDEWLANNASSIHLTHTFFEGRDSRNGVGHPLFSHDPFLSLSLPPSLPLSVSLPKILAVLCEFGMNEWYFRDVLFGAVSPIEDGNKSKFAGRSQHGAIFPQFWKKHELIGGPGLKVLSLPANHEKVGMINFIPGDQGHFLKERDKKIRKLGFGWKKKEISLLSLGPLRRGKKEKWEGGNSSSLAPLSLSLRITCKK